MSTTHPVIAVTGSAGAGTSTAKFAFEHIFRREKINAVIVEGGGFHRYTRAQMDKLGEETLKAGGAPVSQFGLDANLFPELEDLFRQFGAIGGGRFRRYIQDADEAAAAGQPIDSFTPWENVPPGSDVLFYEGLHGGVKTDSVDVARHVDLLIGVVPIVNLEWIQKIYRDTRMRGVPIESVTRAILRQMHDYVYFMTPQYSRTHINFQRVPTVDTSNPFIARDIPTADESFVVIRFRYPRGINFPYLLQMIHNSFMSRPNSIVVPGGKMGLAMQLILTPLILELMQKKRQARGQ